MPKCHIRIQNQVHTSTKTEALPIQFSQLHSNWFAPSCRGKGLKKKKKKTWQENQAAMGSVTEPASSINLGSYKTQVKARHSEFRQRLSVLAAAKQDSPRGLRPSIHSLQLWEADKDRASWKMGRQHKAVMSSSAGATDFPKTRCFCSLLALVVPVLGESGLKPCR